MPFLLALLVALVLAAPAGASELVVRLEPSATPADAARLAASAGGRIVDSVPEIGAYLIDAVPATRRPEAALAASPLVRSIEPNGADEVAGGAVAEPAPPYRGPDWQLTALRAQTAWATTRGQAGIVVAILDTGVDLSRPELAGRLVPGWDTANEDGDPTDTNGHGTFVAGLAAADGQWVTGVCPGCGIMPVKVVADGSTEATKLDSAEGIVWAVDHGARVLNLSIGGTDRAAVQDDAIAYAITRGVVVVASAGNDGATDVQYPAALDGVVSVGGTDDRDRRWSGSTYGPWVTLGAPADRLLSLALPDGYQRRTGTSYAAPLVAGAAGLLLSAFPERSGHEVAAALRAGTDPLADAQRAFDRGRLDLPAALNRLGSPATPALTIVQLAVSPQTPFVAGYPQARAGLDFAVGAVVVSDAGGGPVSGGDVSCAARAAGRTLAVRKAGFSRGAAVCVLGVPARAGARWIEGTIRVERDGYAIEQQFRVKAKKLRTLRGRSASRYAPAPPALTGGRGRPSRPLSS